MLISLTKLQNCIYQDHATGRKLVQQKNLLEEIVLLRKQAHKSYKYIPPAVHFIQHNTNTKVRMLLTAPTIHESQKRPNF